MPNPIPQTILPAELNKGITAEDVTFTVVQTSTPAETVASVETNLNPETDKPRCRWELHLKAMEDKNLDDIEKVQYTLHPSIPNNVRKVYTRGNGFQVKSAGWGVYPIMAEVFLHSGKKITFLHMLSFGQPE